MATIQGDLPFNSLYAAGVATQPIAAGDTSAAALGNAYNTAYKSALDFNAANYGNVLKGYQDTLAGQTSALDAVGRGYTDLSQRVLDSLAGAGARERQAIADRTALQLSQVGQSAVSRGLGNSTVLDSLSRGVMADQNKAYVDLADRLAQQRAGYTSQLGLAGLAQQQQAALANSALGQNQLGFMERVNAPYPDAAFYSSLAAQRGAADEARRQAEAIQAAGRANQPMPQSPGTVSRGGGGFFTSPTDLSSGGSYQPSSPYGGVASARPAPSGMFAQPSAVGAFNGYAGIGGVSPAAGSALGGAAGFGGVADQMNPNLIYPGEGGMDPFAALGGGAVGYGSYLPASSGGAGIGAGGLDYASMGLYGGDLNYGAQSSLDYFGY